MTSASTLFSALAEAHNAPPQHALEILSSLPPFATRWIIEAEKLLGLGRHREALAAVNKALESAPNSAGAEALKARIEAGIKPARKPTFAVLFAEPVAKPIEFSQTKSPEPTTPEPGAIEISNEENTGLVSETLAKIMVRQGKYAEAKKLYIQLARENPHRFEHYSQLMAELEVVIKKNANPG